MTIQEFLGTLSPRSCTMLHMNLQRLEVNLEEEILLFNYWTERDLKSLNKIGPKCYWEISSKLKARGVKLIRSSKASKILVRTLEK